MRCSRLCFGSLLFLLLAASLLFLLLAASVLAGTEVVEIDPLADKDLYHFKQEGEKGWKLDDKSDDIDTWIVHEKTREESALVFVRRTFKNGYRVSMDVYGGSRSKGLEFYVVPQKGDRILVPISPRWLARKGWHTYVVTVEDGKVSAQVDDEKTESIDVPWGGELSFALQLDKGSEARIRRLEIKFLVVSEEQMKPEQGFVRLFDGKSADGWITVPEDAKGAFKVGDQKIDGKFAAGPDHYAQFVYADAVFTDYVFRFKASSDTRGLHLLAASNDIPAIDDYFQRDRDWNEVEWEVKNKRVTLKINGNVALTKTLSQEAKVNPMFLLQPGGSCTLRDIRVGGTPQGARGTWQKYAADSGMVGIGGSGSPGDGDTTGERRGPGERVLFNGTDLTDWQVQPAAGNVWDVADGKIVGLTLGMQARGQCMYGKLVFTDYRIKFKIQRGTKGAKFVARQVPKQVADRPTVAVDIKPDWIDMEHEWTEMVAVVFDGKLTVTAGGKVVHQGSVPVERGFIGFLIGADSAIGVKDIVWERPQ